MADYEGPKTNVTTTTTKVWRLKLPTNPTKMSKMWSSIDRNLTADKIERWDNTVKVTSEDDEYLLYSYQLPADAVPLLAPNHLRAELTEAQGRARALETRISHLQNINERLATANATRVDDLQNEIARLKGEIAYHNPDYYITEIKALKAQLTRAPRVFSEGVGWQPDQAPLGTVISILFDGDRHQTGQERLATKISSKRWRDNRNIQYTNVDVQRHIDSGLVQMLRWAGRERPEENEISDDD